MTPYRYEVYINHFVHLRKNVSANGFSSALGRPWTVQARHVSVAKEDSNVPSQSKLNIVVGKSFRNAMTHSEKVRR